MQQKNPNPGQWLDLDLDLSSTPIWLSHLAGNQNSNGCRLRQANPSANRLVRKCKDWGWTSPRTAKATAQERKWVIPTALWRVRPDQVWKVPRLSTKECLIVGGPSGNWSQALGKWTVTSAVVWKEKAIYKGLFFFFKFDFLFNIFIDTKLGIEQW